MNRARTVPIPPSEEILKQSVVDPTLKSDSAYSHLANMICMYDPEKNKFDPIKSIKKRSNHTKVVVNHYGLSRAYTDSLKFLGVTRDHLSDGGTSGFTVCVDGIVSILQPAEHISTYKHFQLGNYVALSKMKRVGKLGKSFTETRLLTGMSAEMARQTRNASRVIGRIVERRSLHGDVLRVKLLPFGLRIPDDSEVVNPGAPTPLVTPPPGALIVATTAANLTSSVGDSDGDGPDDGDALSSTNPPKIALVHFPDADGDIDTELKRIGEEIEIATNETMHLYNNFAKMPSKRDETTRGVKDQLLRVQKLVAGVKEMNKDDFSDADVAYRAHLLQHEVYLENMVKLMKSVGLAPPPPLPSWSSNGPPRNLAGNGPPGFAAVLSSLRGETNLNKTGGPVKRGLGSDLQGSINRILRGLKPAADRQLNPEPKTEKTDLQNVLQEVIPNFRGNPDDKANPDGDSDFEDSDEDESGDDDFPPGPQIPQGPGSSTQATLRYAIQEVLTAPFSATERMEHLKSLMSESAKPMDVDNSRQSRRKRRQQRPAKPPQRNTRRKKTGDATA